MRKVLSFVLVLSLVLGSFSMAFAAPLSDVAGEDFEDAVNVLTELGVVSGYPDGTYKPDNIVTRAEMAVIVVRALGLADYATGVSSFSDMAGHWSNPYVAYATSLGVIAGYPDGTFKPDATVTYDEAATMLVAALGFTPESLQGTWPANYVVKAKSLGILDGIKAGPAGATRGDIAIMAFQTLDAKIGSTDKDGKWDANDPVDNMLKRLGAKEYKADAKGEAQPFLVTKGIADDAIANLMPYIGAWITAYENSDGDIIAVKEVKSDFLTGKRQTNGKFKAGGVEYTISGATFGATTDGAVKFVNGEEVDGSYVTKAAVLSDKNDVTIAVDLSGKTIKKVYSVSEWTVDAHGFFSDADADDIWEDNELFGYDFEEDDNGDIDTKSFALFGANSLSDIEEDSVVYVYASDDKITRIEVGTEVHSGEVTRITTDDEYTIGGKVFKFAAQEDAKSYSSPKTKDEVKVYLDYAGDIYKCEKIKGEAENYAVVLDVADGAPGFAGKEPKINLFLADGTAKAFEADEEEIADAILDEASKLWITSGGITTGGIIKYSVNDKGVIDEIVTTGAYTSEDGKVTAKGYYKGLEIDNGVVIFTTENLSSLSKKADDYGITTLDKILDSDDVKAHYVVDDGVIVAMLIEADVVSDDVYGVILGAAQNNSDAGYEIKFNIDKDDITYNAKRTPYNTAEDSAKRDRLYKIEFNTNGDVSRVEEVTPPQIYTDNPTKAGLSVSGRVVTVTTSEAVEGEGVTTDGAVFTLSRDVVVYTWNENDSVYKEGRIRDIEDATGYVRFYDVYGDGDKIYDIVLVKL
jgi:hypothetical protein